MPRSCCGYYGQVVAAAMCQVVLRSSHNQLAWPSHKSMDILLIVLGRDNQQRVLLIDHDGREVSLSEVKKKRNTIERDAGRRNTIGLVVWTKDYLGTDPDKDGIFGRKFYEDIWDLLTNTRQHGILRERLSKLYRQERHGVLQITAQRRQQAGDLTESDQESSSDSEQSSSDSEPSSDDQDEDNADPAFE